MNLVCKYSIMLEYPWKLANTKKCSTMTKVACVDAYLQSKALVEYQNSSSNIISLKLDLASKKSSALYPPT